MPSRINKFSIAGDESNRTFYSKYTFGMDGLELLFKKKYNGRYLFYKENKVRRGKLEESTILIYDCERKIPIGHMDLDHSEWHYPSVTYTYILSKYRGLGLGKELYRRALEHYGGLISDDQQTKDSKMVWMNMIKNGNVFVLHQYEASRENLNISPIYWDTEEDKPEVVGYPERDNPMNSFCRFFAIRCRKPKSLY